MRYGIAALLVGILVSVVFAAGCAGDEEETSEDTTEEQTTEQADEEATEERTEARKGKEAREEEVSLEINGDPGTEFSGSCTIGDEETELSGQAPESFTYELDGERLDCEITKVSADGTLEVVFTAGDNTRSVQRISGGTLSFAYEEGRLSSFSTSGGGSSSSQVVSSSQSSSSSVSISP